MITQVWPNSPLRLKCPTRAFGGRFRTAAGLSDPVIGLRPAVRQVRGGASSNVSQRGPYRPRARTANTTCRPSKALAENLRDYRALRRVKQNDLADRMAYLGHGWTRSTVSAIEGNGRSVSVDELLGLALCLDVTIGQLLDPAGPARSRNVSLDIGLREPDGGPLPARMAQLWTASRTVMRFFHDEGRALEVVVAQEPPDTAQLEMELDGLRPAAETPAPGESQEIA